MRIRCGFRIAHECSQPVPMLLALSVHPSRQPDLITQPELRIDPTTPLHRYHDDFGNMCHRVVAPKGRSEMSTEFDIQDSGLPDPIVAEATQFDVESLPDGALVYFGMIYALVFREVRRHAAGLGAGASDLRLCPRAHHLWLRACPSRQDGLGRL